MNKCPYFNNCGACEYNPCDYDASIVNKKKYLNTLFKNKYNFYSLTNPYHSRNKVIYTFKNTKNGLVAGLYRPNSHDVLAIKDCLVQNEIANNILKDIVDIADKLKLKAFREDYGDGLLRHVYIRVSDFDQKAMITFVLANTRFPLKRKLIENLRALHPEIVSIYFNYNSRKTSVVLGEKLSLEFGNRVLKEHLGPFSFEISPKSFFQVNPKVAMKIYEDALKEAEVSNEDVVVDAYAGTGTISLFLSLKAKKVISVEKNKDASFNAYQNALKNNVNNIEFINADMSEVYFNEKIDIVVSDPPRSGMSKIFINTLKRIKPKRIIYISCNPISLKRDLKDLGTIYQLKTLNFYDQFSFSEHIEGLAVLERR